MTVTVFKLKLTTGETNKTGETSWLENGRDIVTLTDSGCYQEYTCFNSS